MYRYNTWFLNHSLYNVMYAVCYLHIKQIAISQVYIYEERYGKTIDGDPLSFQEFFQIRQT